MHLAYSQTLVRFKTPISWRLHAPAVQERACSPAGLYGQCSKPLAGLAQHRTHQTTKAQGNRPGPCKSTRCKAGSQGRGCRAEQKRDAENTPRSEKHASPKRGPRAAVNGTAGVKGAPRPVPPAAGVASTAGAARLRTLRTLACSRSRKLFFDKRSAAVLLASLQRHARSSRVPHWLCKHSKNLEWKQSAYLQMAALWIRM